jgi:hypothetical protein
MAAPYYQSRGKPSKGRPPDNIIIAGFRFMILTLAIVAWPVAMMPYSPLLAATSAVAIGFTAVFFTTPGDAKRVFLPTPGPIRAGIEILIHIAAVGGSLLAWPPIAGLASIAVFLTSLLVGFPRLLWLLRGAPEAEQTEPLPDYYDHLLNEDEGEA